MASPLPNYERTNSVLDGLDWKKTTTYKGVTVNAEAAKVGVYHIGYPFYTGGTMQAPHATSGMKLRSDDAKFIEDLRGLMSHASKVGGTIVSGLRTKQDIIRIWNSRNTSTPFDQRVRTLAPPGFSEHQTGYAVDFSSTNYSDWSQGGKFSKLGDILDAMAHKYGFVKTYTREANASIGVSVEEWHWKYIGSDKAREALTPPGMTLRQILEISYPGAKMQKLLDGVPGLKEYLSKESPATLVSESADISETSTNSQGGGYDE